MRVQVVDTRREIVALLLLNIDLPRTPVGNRVWTSLFNRLYYGLG